MSAMKGGNEFNFEGKFLILISESTKKRKILEEKQF